jgi:phospholipid/cholesterol/gamma-HCH transport system substrate-binding protein
MFQPTIKISTVFRDVRGLKVGNNVRFTGIEVGSIVNIAILSDTAVSVEMNMDRSVVPYIKKDSRATIGNDGLMGNKIVVILPGTTGSEPVESGDVLPSIKPVEIDDIIINIRESSEKISKVADNLIEITEKINGGYGLFGKVFTDSDFSEDIERTGKNIAELTGNLVVMTDKLNNEQGIMGEVLFDTAFAGEWENTSKSLNEISAHLEEFTSLINSSEGVIGKLVADTAMAEDLSRISHNLDLVLENLKDVSMKINDEKNALHKFVADPAFADSVDILLDRVNKGVVEVTQAAKSIQKSRLLGGSSKKDKKK